MADTEYTDRRRTDGLENRLGRCLTLVPSLVGVDQDVILIHTVLYHSSDKVEVK